MKTPLEFWKKHISCFVALVSEYYPLNAELLQNYRLFWLWHKVSINPFINWTPALLEEHKFDIDWTWFCEHSNLPYLNQEDYLFYQKVNWDEYYWEDLSQMISVIIDIYNIEKRKINKNYYGKKLWPHHVNLISWNDYEFYDSGMINTINSKALNRILADPKTNEHILSKAYNHTIIPTNFLEQHKSILDWDTLSRVSHLYWNYELLLTFESYWDFSGLYQFNQLMEFGLKPFIDHDFIHEVLENVKARNIKPFAEFFQNSHWHFHYV
jgi:hypothetical protein